MTATYWLEAKRSSSLSMAFRGSLRRETRTRAEVGVDTRELVIAGTPHITIRNAVAGLPHKRPSLAIRLLHQSEPILDDFDRMRGVAPSGYLLAFGYLLCGRSRDDTDAGQFREYFPVLPILFPVRAARIPD
jgi:hypothetical protein